MHTIDIDIYRYERMWIVIYGIINIYIYVCMLRGNSPTSFSKAFTLWSCNPHVSRAVAKTSKLHAKLAVHWTTSWPFWPLANFSQGEFRRNRDLTRPIFSHLWARRGMNFRARFGAICYTFVALDPWEIPATDTHTSEPKWSRATDNTWRQGFYQ